MSIASSGEIMLLTLPSETICHVIHFLPSKDALQIPNVCRRLNTICDDWILWRSLVGRDATIDMQALSQWTPREMWKRYVHADALLQQDYSDWLPLKSFRWLPQLIAAKRRSQFLLTHFCP
jgi:hypothetical protein